MNLLKPKKLQKGDAIAIIAPAGNIDYEKILSGKKYFESKGFNVKLGNNINNSDRYFSGNDEERLSDLHDAFSDNSVNAIVCARGGYGALRLIDNIDYELIKNNPKIFCGYSDITVLNAVFLKKSNLITFSSPMIQGDFANEINTYTESEFFKTLTSEEIKIIANNPVYYNTFKKAEGVLIGGNLSTFVSLCGTDFLPDEKFMLFAEDLNEPSYKIDRYFTQLFNIEKFKNNVSAILLGDFLEPDNEEYLNAVFSKIAEKFEIPVIKGFPFSHTKVKTTVPYGAYAVVCDNTITVQDYLT